MKTTIAKILRFAGKLAGFVLIAAILFFLLAERLFETPFEHFIRSLM